MASFEGNFDEKVLLACARIPRGKVTTYAALAKAIGKPRAARAVGNALNKNPFPYVGKRSALYGSSLRVPCHRVVRSDGSVGGYAFGAKKKIKLLRAEGVEVSAGGKIDWSQLYSFNCD